MSDVKEETPSKQAKLFDESNEMAVADPTNHPLPPSPTTIFNLKIDCCDEIFEYLSTKDLYSFGSTCKAMQKVAGEYFKRNCFGAEKFTHAEGIYTSYYDYKGGSNKRILTSDFNKYITNLTQYGEELPLLRYIESHSDEFDSVNSLNFVLTHIDMEKVKFYRRILPKIKHIQLHQCRVDGDIFEILLQYCENMTHLTIHDDFGDIIGTENPWLNQTYPKLKQLHLCPNNVNEFSELASFFKRNPQIQMFLTNFLSLWENRNQVLNCTAKLDLLSVEDCWFHSVEKIEPIFDVLKQLHEKGFYQRLNLYLTRIDQQNCEQMASLPGLEKLRFDQYTTIKNLICLSNLKELHLPVNLGDNEIEVIATNLLNLEKVTISSIEANDLMPFLRYSTKLTKLYAYLKDDFLNLPKMNKERNKLQNARKVIIYVRDNIYLNTKWTNGQINLKFVGMRRINSAVPAEVTNVVKLPGQVEAFPSFGHADRRVQRHNQQLFFLVPVTIHYGQ